jgi:hypothetical protein
MLMGRSINIIPLIKCGMYHAKVSHNYTSTYVKKQCYCEEVAQ